MKIALIFPRLAGQVHGMWPPLGIITLGTILREAGHSVTCHDLSFDPDLARIQDELRRLRPEVVGVSCLTDFFPNAAELVRFAKAQGAITIMGGPHPTIAAPETMDKVPELDYAVLGEGERTLPALLEAIAGRGDASAIPGLALRVDGAIKLTGPHQPIEDLDSIPIPDRDLLDVHPQYLRARAINLHASRGCPFRCRFCQPTLKRMFGAQVRFQSPERVAAEIRACHDKYGITDFFFHDDTFTVKKSWLAGMVRALAAAGLRDGFRYVVNSRVDTFDEERAGLLREMGVYYVLFGVETGSQEVLDSIGKGATVAQAREAFRICRQFGFRTHAYVLLGSPKETPDSLRATEALVAELKPHTVHISIYTPLLGTDLADECERLGLIQIKDYTQLDYYLKRTASGLPPITIPGLTYQDLLDSRGRILARRKLRVLLDNFIELGRDLYREPRLDKFLFRYRFYRRMQHYFG
jgi:anaerobic magnesium-protoporphyrin IX monomethyl ester cyclase